MKKRIILMLIVSIMSGRRRHVTSAFSPLVSRPFPPSIKQTPYRECKSRLYQQQGPSSDDAGNDEHHPSDTGAPSSSEPTFSLNDNANSIKSSSSSSIPHSSPTELKSSSLPSYKSMILFVSTTILIWLSEPLLSLVDTTLVGRQSSSTLALTQLAALGPATMLIDSMVYLTYFLSIATTSKLATSLAQFDYRDLQVTCSHILGIAGILGGIITATVYTVGTPLLTWCAGDAGNAALIQAALSYTRIRCSVSILSIMGMVAQSICLAVQDTTTPVVAVVVASLVNIIGDGTLIPKFGIQGAAAATAAASVASTVVLLASIREKVKKWNRLANMTKTVNGNNNGATKQTIVVDGKPVLKQKNATTVSIESIRNGTAVSLVSNTVPFSTDNDDDKSIPFLSLPDQRSFGDLLSLVGPIFFVLLGKIVCYSSLTLKATSFGMLSVATHNIMMRIFFFHATFGDSLTQAAQTYLPSTLLERDNTNMKRLLKKLVVLATGIGLATFASTKIVLKMGRLFTSNVEIVASMAKHTNFISLAVLLHSFIMVLEGAIIATGDLKYLVATYSCTMGVLFAQLKFASPHFAAVWFALLLFQTLRLLQFKSRVIYRVLFQPSATKRPVTDGAV